MNWKLITNDPKDDKFADLAISANVKYLVTNDHDFDVLKSASFPTIRVVSLTHFQKILGYSWIKGVRY